jgi:hypothetical protein
MEVRMRRLWIAFLVGTLLLGLLSGCAPGESNKVNCSAGGEVCITLQMDDFFKAADPVKVEITVTSKIDIADLYVGLRYDPRIILEVPETWENFVSPAYEGAGLSGWFVKIKAGEKLTFTRTLHFPAETGWYSVGARFNHNIPPYVGSEGVSILILDEKGQVIGYLTLEMRN